MHSFVFCSRLNFLMTVHLFNNQHDSTIDPGLAATRLESLMAKESKLMDIRSAFFGSAKKVKN